MFQVLHNFFYSFTPVDFEISLIVFLSVSLATLFLDIILSVFLCNFTLIKRTFYLVVIIAIYVFSKSLFMEKGYFICAEILLSINLLLGLPLLFIRVKRIEDCSLNKLIDRAIESQDLDDEISQSEIKIERLKCLPKENLNRDKDFNDEIDFSHVLGILERLNYYPLSTSDKNKMRELEAMILQAERGESEDNYKLKINEGLGELLKIMSRYGV